MKNVKPFTDFGDIVHRLTNLDMKTYRLVNATNEEIIFGIENLINNATLDKLRKGINKCRPYNHVVPHYKNDKFAFISLNAFKYFLFGVCNLTYSDILELEKLGYKVTIQDLECYSRGLSKLFCTYFDNEIVELKEVLLSELFENADSCNYSDINQPAIQKELIKDCKDQYYKNVKFKK